MSELTATAMSICPFCPIISSSTTIIIISRRVLQSSAKFGSTGAGDRDRRRFHKGGGAFLDRHTLFSFRACALGIIRKSYLGVPYPRPLSQISVAIYSCIVHSYSCIVHSYSCIVHSFMTALGRNGQSYTLSPQFVLVCKFNVHDAQTKLGTLAKFDSPGQSLVETASPRHDIIIRSGQNISVSL